MYKSAAKALTLLALFLATDDPAWSQTTIETDGDVQEQGFIGDGSQLTDVDADLLDSMDSSAFAQDSDLQSLEALVAALQAQVEALEPPDPPCFDNATRFVNCSNGTVTDTVTGLIWVEDADCFVATTYSAANALASGLAEGECSLTDGSRPGDWRLPTKEEWDAMIRTSGECPTPPTIVGNGLDSSTSCYSDDPWASGVQTSFYWSSTTDSLDTEDAWEAQLSNGIVNDATKTIASNVWAVRVGQ